MTWAESGGHCSGRPVRALKGVMLVAPQVRRDGLPAACSYGQPYEPYKVGRSVFVRCGPPAVLAVHVLQEEKTSGIV